MQNPFENPFDGKKQAKLGTPKNPATIRVQSKKRVKELAEVFDQHGWAFTSEVDPKQPENIADLEILLHPAKTVTVDDKPGRNDPCPCGSGKKYKKCCGQEKKAEVKAQKPKMKSKAKAEAK